MARHAEDAVPSLFEVREGLHPLDHGSNGLSMRPAQEAAALWRAHMDQCPGQFVQVRPAATCLLQGAHASPMRQRSWSMYVIPVAGFDTVTLQASDGAAVQEDVVPELAATVAAVARFAGARPEDCFPASTPSAVLATLLSALAPADGGSLLVLSIAEGAAKAVVGRCAARAGLSIVELQVTQDMLADSDLLLQQLRATLAECDHGLRAAVLPHVLSFPPAVLPVADLVATCTQVRCSCASPAASAVCLRGPRDVAVEGGSRACSTTSSRSSTARTPLATCLWTSRRSTRTRTSRAAARGSARRAPLRLAGWQSLCRGRSRRWWGCRGRGAACMRTAFSRVPRTCARGSRSARRWR